MFGKKKKIIVETRTVLFVDDDEIVLQSLERGLLDESYNKLFVKNCQEAFEILKQEAVHVIVADMYMPEMNGEELGTNIKSSQENKDLSMIMLTSIDEQQEPQKLRDIGFDFCLTKPVLQSELYNILLQLVQGESHSCLSSHSASEAIVNLAKLTENCPYRFFSYISVIC